MGRIAVVNFMSIDGVIQSPLSADEDRAEGFHQGGWVTPFSDDTVDDYMRAATVNADGLLLGGRTYRILADAWSDADPSDAAVAAMNRTPKYVVSRNHELDWANSHRIDDDMSRGVRDLKRRMQGDLVVLGSGELVRGLAEHDLVDEYRLLVFPVLLGAGKRMFDDRSGFARFTLTDSTSSASGVVMLTYTRDAAIQLTSGR